MTVGVMNATSLPVKYGMPRLMKMASSMTATSTRGTVTDLNTMAMIRKMAAMEM